MLMGYGERLRLIRGEQNRADFARKLGVHSNTIGRWEREEQAPNLEDINIILFTNPHIDPTWLLTGEGEMRRGDTPITVDPSVHYTSSDKAYARLDEEQLQAVLEAVEEYLDSIDGHLPATKKAQLVAMLYEMCSESVEKKIDKAAVIRLVKLAA